MSDWISVEAKTERQKNKEITFWFNKGLTYQIQDLIKTFVACLFDKPLPEPPKKEAK